eukprot:4319548-Pyramimonas_sp.AAC.1
MGSQQPDQPTTGITNVKQMATYPYFLEAEERPAPMRRRTQQLAERSFNGGERQWLVVCTGQ